MLKLTLKPGDYVDIGDDVRVVFSGGSSDNIHLLIGAPREKAIVRSSVGGKRAASPYYREKAISKEAQQEIVGILRRERGKTQE